MQTFTERRILIIVIICVTLSLFVVVFSLLVAGFYIKKREKPQEKPEVIYEEPDCVYNIKMDDNVSYGHIF